ncbi:MAG: hypothetical protein MRERC_7c026 [Mycoplasmataceae bacterium RC_NB112A]|nr:MAG: hypothetical protein MRERC_8c026 [Mycoplasmataceae bacterium RC_NB112A]KLL01872.1 MAG: hypothetical protein MRERC_7c026 [Mycoplasmataceae bacterium RC_NB112A]
MSSRNSHRRILIVSLVLGGVIVLVGAIVYFLKRKKLTKK